MLSDSLNLNGISSKIQLMEKSYFESNYVFIFPQDVLPVSERNTGMTREKKTIALL